MFWSTTKGRDGFRRRAEILGITGAPSAAIAPRSRRIDMWFSPVSPPGFEEGQLARQ
jgi:hypothetical protein